jgi:predicted 2-oxoglutarate/Fe(II)-dependent dioxygenase YbiX
MIEKRLFTDKECEQIMNLEGGRWFESKTVNSIDQELHSINPFRISTQRQVLIPKDSFITENLKQFGVKKIIQTQKFRYQEELDYDKSKNIASILKYTKGGKFKRHQDRGSKGTEWRYRTILIQLSNEDEYEGGDLSVWDTNNNETKISKQRGNAVMFDSRLYHQVHPLISGTRYVLVMWLPHESFEIKKTVL